MTSNANDLTERLRRRLETERQAIEELTARRECLAIVVARRRDQGQT